MTRALSIVDAAAEHPERVALIVNGSKYRYRELAERVKQAEVPPLTMRAPATLQTALALYKSLEDSTTSAFISQNTSDAELRDLGARVAARQLPNATLILFTSGSSGKSKGVRLSHRALAASALAANEHVGWREDDRWLCCLPLSHIGGLSVLLRALAARRTAVVCDRFEVANVADALSSQRISHISLVPTMLWRLLEAGVTAPEHLRITLMGGAALPVPLALRARDAGYAVLASYGMTETSSMVVCDGKALPGVSLRIEHDGAIVIAGPTLMDGYLDGWSERPTPTVELRTSDRGVLDNQGALRVLGRLDATIISGGENIDLSEVERALLAMENVSACMALGLPDAEWGERLVALIVRRDPSRPIGSVELQGHKAPKQLIYVQSLPLLENGKPDRIAAAAIAQQSSL